MYRNGHSDTRSYDQYLVTPLCQECQQLERMGLPTFAEKWRNIFVQWLHYSDKTQTFEQTETISLLTK
jgi:hypothetical protein